MEQVCILAAARSPIGALSGQLSGLSASQIQQQVIKGLLEARGIPLDQVEEVILGQVLTAGAGMNPARQAALGAGIPVSAPCALINQVCGSGLRSIDMGAQLIQRGDTGLVVTGGQESMTNAPHVLRGSRAGKKMGEWPMVDSMVHDGLWDIFHDYHMGSTAENIVERYGISREEQDRYALSSHERARAALEDGRFREEIIAIDVPVKRGETEQISEDEGFRRKATMEQFARLRPVFKKDGSVTAGNSSSINDGAAAVVLASEAKAEALGIEPLARIKAFASAGVEPAFMGLGPVPATRRCLERAGWSIKDLDLIEANEAFAAQVMAMNRDLGWDSERINVNGGAIVLGHPIGASGARLLTTLLHEMGRRDARKGLVTLCVGGGMGVAMAVER